MIERLVGQALEFSRRGAVTLTGTGIRVLRRLNAALDPRAPSGPADLLPSDSLARLAELLGARADAEDDEPVSEEELRARFTRLLEKSQEPSPPDGTHPALPHIVDQLSPDEARIIRLLWEQGPQPVISVVATPLLGSGEFTMLEGVSLVSERAGCHLPDRAPAYLDNLERLGLVRREQHELVGHDDYELLGARPEVARAEEQIRDERNQRVQLIRGQVRLTPLGDLLCAVCLRQDAVEGAG